MKRVLIMACVMLARCMLFSQDLTLYQKRWLVQGKDTLPYRLLLPEKYDSTKKYPLIFFLHGAGERGNDNSSQLTHGASLFLEPATRQQFPAIVVFPQCSASGYWSNAWREFDSTKAVNFTFLQGGDPTNDMRLLQELIMYIIINYPVQKEQVYVGGLSMGGMGTFELARRNPTLFAAAFPICGGAHPATAKIMRHINWWIFHGAKDDVVKFEYSAAMSEALKKNKATVKFSLYPEANHNSWDLAFAERRLNILAVPAKKKIK